MTEDATRTRSVPDRWFYISVAIASSVLVFAGFARSYFLRTAFGFPTLSAILHLHGLVMTLWFVLMVLASLSIWLPAVSRLPLHFIEAGSLWTSIAVGDACVLAWVAGDTVRNRRLPNYQKNYNTGGRIGYEKIDEARVATIRVFHNGEHASRLILPLAAPVDRQNR